jgi:hypothetical protein
VRGEAAAVLPAENAVPEVRVRELQEADVEKREFIEDFSLLTRLA